MRGRETSSLVACVLYRDDATPTPHWAPLTELFVSSDGTLVSAHPTSSTVEVDSIYCPECLELYTDADVRAHRGRCPHCAGCPRCGVVLRPTAADDEGRTRWTYTCAACAWSSAAIALVEDSPEHLALSLAQREKDEPRLEAFARLLARHARVRNDDKDDDMKDGGTTNDDHEEETPPPDGPDPPPPAPAETTVGLAARLRQPFRSDETTASVLLPVRVPLCARRSRRSRWDVARGRAGIVYKPTRGPLEGDSSTGARFLSSSSPFAKKDSSAVLVVPRCALAAPVHVRVVATEEANTEDAESPRHRVVVEVRLVVEVSNPHPSRPLRVALCADSADAAVPEPGTVLAPPTLASRAARTVYAARSVDCLGGRSSREDAEDTAWVDLAPADDDDDDLGDDDDDGDDDAEEEEGGGPSAAFSRRTRGVPTPADLVARSAATTAGCVLVRGRTAWFRCDATLPAGEAGLLAVPLRLLSTQPKEGGHPTVDEYPVVVALPSQRDWPAELLDPPGAFRELRCAYRAFL
eukprot:CAMPEP_0185693368 /NCGR_PEP_ID=MMETSP1164-20130828/3178_1 /TAXON_ID=1104430 /ORGANISM="Chrysoreinhardia sp, Strain CCMP2950" /LENGTH=522 /DNA_ID=CAMNT_0028360145 /DNA_START=14 /DNA_END=1582 /DNA_ORIENTATION=-